jgi:hypothetical protein
LPLGPRKLRTSSWWTNMLKIISKFKKNMPSRITNFNMTDKHAKNHLS